MVQTKLPQWLENKYTLLFDKLKSANFTMEHAESILHGSDLDKVKGVAVVLSELRKAGWIDLQPNPEDARKSIYRLKSKEEIIKSLFDVNKLSRTDIESILKKAADLIRTRVDYKFILILLFYKRISDKWEAEYQKAYDEALHDGFNKTEAEEEARNAAYHEFVNPMDYLWENIRKDVTQLPEKFSQALKLLDNNYQVRN